MNTAIYEQYSDPDTVTFEWGFGRTKIIKKNIAILYPTVYVHLFLWHNVVDLYKGLQVSESTSGEGTIPTNGPENPDLL